MPCSLESRAVVNRIKCDPIEIYDIFELDRETVRETSLWGVKVVKTNSRAQPAGVSRNTMSCVCVCVNPNAPPSLSCSRRRRQELLFRNRSLSLITQQHTCSTRARESCQSRRTHAHRFRDRDQFRDDNDDRRRAAQQVAAEIVTKRPPRGQRNNYYYYYYYR